MTDYYYQENCPYCGVQLRTDKARQCFKCGKDWHDPRDVVDRRTPFVDNTPIVFLLDGTSTKKTLAEHLRENPVQLAHADLRNLDFPREVCDLRNADFTGANLQGVKMLRLGLQVASFANADLANADLSGCLLWSARFQGASLRYAILVGAWLTQVNLRGIRLEKANLADAILDHADFSEADLTGAMLCNANLNS